MLQHLSMDNFQSHQMSSSNPMNQYQNNINYTTTNTNNSTPYNISQSCTQIPYNTQNNNNISNNNYNCTNTSAFNDFNFVNLNNLTNTNNNNDLNNINNMKTQSIINLSSITNNPFQCNNNNQTFTNNQSNYTHNSSNILFNRSQTPNNNISNTNSSHTYCNHNNNKNNQFPFTHIEDSNCSFHTHFNMNMNNMNNNNNHCVIHGCQSTASLSGPLQKDKQLPDNFSIPIRIINAVNNIPITGQIQNYGRACMLEMLYMVQLLVLIEVMLLMENNIIWICIIIHGIYSCYRRATMYYSDAYGNIDAVICLFMVALLMVLIVMDLIMIHAGCIGCTYIATGCRGDGKDASDYGGSGDSNHAMKRCVDSNGNGVFHTDQQPYMSWYTPMQSLWCTTKEYTNINVHTHSTPTLSPLNKHCGCLQHQLTSLDEVYISSIV